MDAVAEIRRELQKLADPERKKGAERYFKHEVKLYGVRTADARKVGQTVFRQLADRNKDTVFSVCEKLFLSQYLDEAVIASQWAYNIRKTFSQQDIFVFEKWIDRYIKNWAACDTFCTHVVGYLLVTYPETRRELSRWAQSSNLWLRRAAAVSLIIPAKKGRYHDTVFSIADTLLTDPEDMVQKGYGWMLKVAADFDQESVFTYVMKNKRRMPRTALRYAIEKMPPGKKKQAMG